MAITPQEAERRAIPSRETLKELEERIDDEIIRATSAGSFYVSIDADIFPNNAAIRAITDTYRDAGWDVSYHSDQRDGAYVTLQRPKANHR